MSHRILLLCPLCNQRLTLTMTDADEVDKMPLPAHADPRCPIDIAGAIAYVHTAPVAEVWCAAGGETAGGAWRLLRERERKADPQGNR